MSKYVRDDMSKYVRDDCSVILEDERRLSSMEYKDTLSII